MLRGFSPGKENADLFRVSLNAHLPHCGISGRSPELRLFYFKVHAPSGRSIARPNRAQIAPHGRNATKRRGLLLLSASRLPIPHTVFSSDSYLSSTPPYGGSAVSGSFSCRPFHIHIMSSCNGSVSAHRRLPT